MSGKKWIRNVGVGILAVVLACYFLQRLLVPKYVDDVVEGNLIKEYYREEDKDFDVVFFGDCEVYENFSPVKMWEEYGINSYIRGSAQQYIWQSYYLMEETFTYHVPDVVVFNIQALQYDEAVSEAYNRMTLDGMKWSAAKVKSVFASMQDDEHFIEYLFPILRYHARWDELTANDVKYMFRQPDNVAHNGYYMRVDCLPTENVPTGRPLTDYTFGENAWNYLDKMRTLCEENGVTLLLIKAPSLYPYWYEEYDEQVMEYAEKYGLTYINFLDCADEAGIDYSTDTYDAGLHMNLSGAEKLAVYFGKILSEEYGVPDRRDDAALSAVWEGKIEEYDAEIAKQCERYGITYER